MNTMNTMDALRLSIIEISLAKAQNHAAEMEMLLQGFIDLTKVSPFPAPKARLLSTARAYKAVAERIEQVATELERT